ncbi:MAG: DUF6261 family protein, partial [Bacteroidales bacterium]|nr:DUF6261 family protein [Bacteroidales bacterium]
MKQKFHPLKAHRLSNLNLAGLCSETIAAGNAASGVLGSLGTSALGKLNDDYNAFRVKLITEKASPLTEQIRDFDEHRDADFAEIVRTADTAAKSSNPASVEAGKALALFLRPYRGIAKKPIMTQTESIRFLQEQYNADPSLASAAAALQITGVFANLFQANEQVFTLWNARATEDAGKAGPSPSSLRGSVEKSYDGFCDIVVRTLALQPSPPLADLFAVMNETRIKYSRSLPARLAGNNTSVEAIPAQPYTGSPVTPIPRVFFGAEGEKAVELQFSVDFFVTYRDNTKVG